jgi:WD40 repeat protein
LNTLNGLCLVAILFQEAQLEPPTSILRIERGNVDNTTTLGCLALSSDGMTLAAGYSDGRILLWDTERGNQIAEMDGHGKSETGKTLPEVGGRRCSGISCVKFSRIGNIVISGGHDGTVRLWDYKHQKSIARLVLDAQGRLEAQMPFPHPKDSLALEYELTINSIVDLDCSSDGKLIASAAGGVVTIWDIQTRAHIAVLQGHKQKISSVCFSPDAKWVTTSSLDGTLRIWSPVTGKQQSQYGIERGQIIIDEPYPSRALYSKDGKLVAVAFACGSNENVKLFDVDGWKVRYQSKHLVEPSTMAFVHDTGTMLFATQPPECTVWMWDFTNGGEGQFSARSAHKSIRAMSVSSNGKRLITSGNDGKVALWDLDSIPWSKRKN